jgi:hypothetical protein
VLGAVAAVRALLVGLLRLLLLLRGRSLWRLIISTGGEGDGGDGEGAGGKYYGESCTSHARQAGSWCVRSV